MLRHIVIDIVGQCNLRCPTCPAGSLANSTGVMPVTDFDLILRKARHFCIPRITPVSLFSWGEPFLHPDIGDIIRKCHQYGFPAWLSTNLNDIRHLDAILAAKPAYIRISVSGWEQKRYKFTHTGGDIEVVKANMRILSEKRSNGTYVEVLFHEYNDNRFDLEAMRQYAAELGFGFETIPAQLLPLEKALLAKAMGENSLSRAERDVLSRFAVPFSEMWPKIPDSSHIECPYQTDYLVINHKGQQQLCCAVYDESKFTLGDIDPSHRPKHPYCGICMKHGGHLYSTYRSIPMETKPLWERTLDAWTKRRIGSE
jgi:MoaA/NifB/PqqE/SkfB family radical SAM enzyme